MLNHFGVSKKNKSTRSHDLEPRPLERVAQLLKLAMNMIQDSCNYKRINIETFKLFNIQDWDMSLIQSFQLRHRKSVTLDMDSWIVYTFPVPIPIEKL